MEPHGLLEVRDCELGEPRTIMVTFFWRDQTIFRAYAPPQGACDQTLCVATNNKDKAGKATCEDMFIERGREIEMPREGSLKLTLGVQFCVGKGFTSMSG